MKCTIGTVCMKTKKDKLFWVLDSVFDGPKFCWGNTQPKDNETFFIYGTAELYYATYMPVTVDIGFVEEQLQRIYEENTGKKSGIQSARVKRWREKK